MRFWSNRSWEKKELGTRAMREAWVQTGGISWGVAAWAESGKTGKWAQLGTVPRWAGPLWEETEDALWEPVAEPSAQTETNTPTRQQAWPISQSCPLTGSELHSPKCTRKALLNIPGHLCDSCSKTQMKELLPFYNKEVGGEERDFMIGFFFLWKGT